MALRMSCFGGSVLLHVGVHHAAIEVCVGVVRLQGDRLGECVNGLLLVLLGKQSVAQQNIAFRIVGIVLDHVAGLLFRLVELDGRPSTSRPAQGAP